MIRTIMTGAMTLLLTSCGSAGQDGAAGLGAGDAQALNEAAAKLDARHAPAEQTDDAINPAAAMAARDNKDRASPQ